LEHQLGSSVIATRLRMDDRGSVPGRNNVGISSLRHRV